MESLDHPSTDGKAITKGVKVEITGGEKRITDWLGNDLATVLGGVLKLHSLYLLRLKVNQELLRCI